MIVSFYRFVDQMSKNRKKNHKIMEHCLSMESWSNGTDENFKMQKFASENDRNLRLMIFSVEFQKLRLFAVLDSGESEFLV